MSSIELSSAFKSASKYVFYSLMVLGLFMTSCALPQKRIEKRFRDFAAVIVQDGDTLSSLASTYLHDPTMDWFIAEFNGISTPSTGQELIIPFSAYNKGGISRKGYQVVPVLTYHKFSKHKADRMTVMEKTFEKQMKYLRDKGYRVITLDEFFEFLDLKRQIPKNSVVITIDDGWRSAYDIAFPILKKYGYPATLFVYTDLINGSRTTLDWDLLKEMSKGGIEIQCHTRSHRNLIKKYSKESFRDYFDAIKKELTESARIIKKNLNKDVKYLGYPYGDTSHLVIALLKKLGYRAAFTVKRGSNPFFVHDYRIKRSLIYGHFDLRDFRNNLTGYRTGELR
jgi:peptidoglycan/xylan/chitin deacetylase (PgdA/CDA1 family)